MRVHGFADNDGVAIHFIQTVPDHPGGPTVVVIPGLAQPADDYVEYLDEDMFSDAVFISLRGRGESAAPETGYSFEEQLSDVTAVVDHLGLDRFVLLGYSVGVAFALAYTLTNMEKVAGLILVDYPPHYPSIPESWIETVTNPVPVLAPHVARALVKESHRTVMSKELFDILCPVLVIRGGKADSLLSSRNAALYTDRVPDCNEFVIEDMGHDPSDDLSLFTGALLAFIARIAGNLGQPPGISYW